VNLLYVCSDFGIRPNGTKGASVHLRAITEALAARGHDVRVLSPHPGPGRRHPAQRLLAGRRPASIKAVKRAGQWLSGHGYEAEFIQELRPLLYNAWVVPRAVRAVRDNGVPDAIVERLSLLTHVGMDLSREIDRPLILEVNALLSEEASRFRSLNLTTLARAMELRALESASAVVVVSEALRARVGALGVEKRKVHVVPNGADTRRFRPLRNARQWRRRLGLDDRFVIGFAGSLKVWHGVDVLLEAFAKLRALRSDVALLVVGSGPMESDLRAAAKRLRLGSSIHFTGAVEHVQVPRYLNAMDVAVAPFRDVPDFYFSPIKLFEYLAVGKAVLASRLGQIAEVIRSGENGLLCDAGDADALSDGLLRLHDDEALRERLAGAALSTARERFTWDRAAASVETVVRNVVTRRAKRRAG